MIFDCHTHIRFIKKDNAFSDLPKLMQAMDKTEVDKACVLFSPERTVGYFFSREDCIQTAEGIINISPEYSGRIKSLLCLNPNLPFDFNYEIIEKYIINGPIDGVKISIQMNSRDKRFNPVAELLQEYDIPLLFHTWYKTVNKYVYESDPSDIADLASRFPKLRILMAHLTGCGKRGVQDIRRFDNVFIDTSGSQPEDGYLEYVLNMLGADRILFGSDYPGREIAVQLGRIYSVDMNDRQREKILYENAVSFFTKGGRCR